jgi:DNA invertase Pin-like site-specific DNA recombinase
MKKVTKIEENKKANFNGKKLRVAAYCRVSTDSDEQAESLKAQKEHYEIYIKSRDDWEFAGLYYDEGITGTKKEKRPQLRKMMADCKAGKINFILTKSISRFSRNTADCLELTRKLLTLNIPVYFEKEDINTGAMESELFLSILSSMAQNESVSISQNGKWSVQKRFENGTFKISYPPYGYDWNGEKMVINPAQAQVVKRIFSETLSGKSSPAIAEELNAGHIPSRRSSHWTSTTVRDMLTNEKYTGDCLFQKTYTDSRFNRHRNRGEKNRYLLQNHHEAIISHEDFNAAAALIRERAAEKGVEKGNRKYQNRYPFSGKILCGECGSTFKRRIHTCSDSKYAAWCCKTHIEDKSKCSMKFIREDAIQFAFVTMINKLVFAHRLILKPYVEVIKNSSADDAVRRVQKIQTLLLQNAEQRETLQKLMAQGYLDKILYNKEKNELLMQADDLRSEADFLNNRKSEGIHTVTEATALLHFTERGVMLDAFDGTLFEKFVNRILIKSRNELCFELKCGLTLTERI